MSKRMREDSSQSPDDDIDHVDKKSKISNTGDENENVFEDSSSNSSLSFESVQLNPDIKIETESESDSYSQNSTNGEELPQDFPFANQDEFQNVLSNMKQEPVSESELDSDDEFAENNMMAYSMQFPNVRQIIFVVEGNLNYYNLRMIGDESNSSDEDGIHHL